MRNRIIISSLFLTVVVACLGAGRELGGPPANASVRIRDIQYQPASVRIKVGGSVTWTNADDRDHTVDATDNSFQSGNLKPGATFAFRFTKAGSFDYSCQYHPRMRGSVQVEN